MLLIDGIEWNPVSFVPKLIQTIIDDDKTETRRIVQGVPYWDHVLSRPELTRPIMDWPLSGCYLDDEGQAWLDIQTDVDDNSHKKIRCPYGKPGGRLWVRECFAAMRIKSETRQGLNQISLEECLISEADLVVFKDNAIKWKTGAYEPEHRFGTIPVKKWRPPMHLPHKFHRIGLDVKGIAIERVQQITPAAAVAEGMKLEEVPRVGLTYRHPTEPNRVTQLPELVFQWTWNAINGRRKDKQSGRFFTWDLNPFVWVVKFERIKGYHGQEKE